MPAIISDCTQVSVRGNQPSGKWANVFHCIALGSPGPDPEQMAEDLAQAYVSNLLKGCTAQVTFRRFADHQ